MRLLVTGGAGFIGSNFIRYILNTYPDYKIINLDKLTYAGNLDNVKDLENNDRYEFVQGDIVDPSIVDSLAEKVDIIVNFAAESHVDNSNENADPFLRTNIMGVKTLMDAALKYNHKRFFQISTDEVYGDRNEGFFTEESRLKPSNPYSASKASAEMLVMAYARTHGLPTVVSRCANNYGPYQYPEKLLPFFVHKLLSGEKVPVYGNGSNLRDWLHVDDHCKAIDLILHKGKIGEIYNVSANEEHSNLDITKRMIAILGLSDDKIEFVKDRPGHDIRYAIDSSKIQNELGWKPTIKFEEGFEKTVEFYRSNI